MVKKKTDIDLAPATDEQGNMIFKSDAEEPQPEQVQEESAQPDPNYVPEADKWVRICRPVEDSYVEYFIRLGYIHALEGPQPGVPPKIVIRDFHEDSVQARMNQITQDITFDCYTDLRRTLFGV